jgi:hypothetical protein
MTISSNPANYVKLRSAHAARRGGGAALIQVNDGPSNWPHSASMLRIFYARQFSPETDYTFPLVRWVLDGLAILLVCGALFVGAAIAIITIHGWL